MLNESSAAAAVAHGEIIAYPTEAVYGLGCDPFNQDAVQRLLDKKQRSVEQGLIVIATGVKQLADLVAPLTDIELAPALRTWPGPVTWLLPAHDDCPAWITGKHDTIAVRISGHTVCRSLCNAAGPLVSTSANPSGFPPATTLDQLTEYFEDDIFGVVAGALGGLKSPTEIHDLATGKVLRGQQNV